VFDAVGRDPLIDIAIALHQAASQDEYFISRKLYPNVDFWSGLIYKAMGFPLDFFPGKFLFNVMLTSVLFAVPRVAGWLAHWKQQLDSGTNKIWRPRQVYVGEGKRPYVGFEARREIRGLGAIPHFFSTRKMQDRAKL